MDSAHIIKLKQKISSPDLPSDIRERLSDDLARVEMTLKNQGFAPEVERHLAYLQFVSSLPWTKEAVDILDLKRAEQVLNKNHFGLDNVKERILEYMSILILNRRKNQVGKQSVLAFIGLVGSGKTSLAYSIAESLGRPLIRIPFGGLGSAAQLRGESRVLPDAEPGMLLKALARAQVKNPVILLDELDRVTEHARADIMGVLVEILDPEQNMAFLDHYLDSPFDLSKVLFIATANNVNNVATAVLDRLELIEMPFYTDQQKISIGRDYLLPEELISAGLDNKILTIDQAVWPEIVRPLGFDGGIRSLKRNIEALVRRVAKRVVLGEQGPFIVNQQNISQFMEEA